MAATCGRAFLPHDSVRGRHGRLNERSWQHAISKTMTERNGARSALARPAPRHGFLLSLFAPLSAILEAARLATAIIGAPYRRGMSLGA